MSRHHTATPPSVRLRTGVLTLAALAGCGGAISACAVNSPSVVHSYSAFSSAVDKGASCADLFDMKSRYHRDDDLRKIDADLARIGCTSPTAIRSDR